MHYDAELLNRSHLGKPLGSQQVDGAQRGQSSVPIALAAPGVRGDWPDWPFSATLIEVGGEPIRLEG